MNVTARLRLDQLSVTGPVAPPNWRDWMLASILGVLSVLEAMLLAFGQNEFEWPLITLPAALLAAALTVARRQHPLFSLLTALGTVALTGAVVWAFDKHVDALMVHAVSIIVLLYSLCRWASPRSLAIGVTVTAIMVVALALTDGDGVAASLGTLVPWLVVVLVALTMRYRARLLEQQKTQARLEERNVLARELHDTVAHHVSAIAVQAQAAQFVARSDPEASMRAMKAVEDISATAIDDMRRMVGILRSDTDRARTVTPPSLAELGDQPGSPPVTLTGETDLTSFPSPIAAAVFRTCQESITNARRHSRDATFIDVHLAADEHHVRVSIENDGTPSQRNSGSGYGLVGMRERVESLDGTLEHGPRPASGWKVTAVIPTLRGHDSSRS